MNGIKNNVILRSPRSGRLEGRWAERQPDQFRLNSGITTFANQRSCSMNSPGGRPSAQWIMKSSRPGYFASIDLMPSMICSGGPQNHAFCFTPSARLGTLAGAPGVPQVRPSSSA